MQLAWTGVIRSKPMLETASRIHGDKAGVRLSHARVAPVAAGCRCAGAMVQLEHRHVSGALQFSCVFAREVLPKSMPDDTVSLWAGERTVSVFQFYCG